MLGKLVLAAGLVASGAALAQPASPPEASVVVRAPRQIQQGPAKGPLPARLAHGDAPLDHGPNTPDANAAYQGGGMILEGPPGAPAPTPAPTPPGVTPRYMVVPGAGY